MHISAVSPHVTSAEYAAALTVCAMSSRPAFVQRVRYTYRIPHFASLSCECLPEFTSMVQRHLTPFLLRPAPIYSATLDPDRYSQPWPVISSGRLKQDAKNVRPGCASLRGVVGSSTTYKDCCVRLIGNTCGVCSRGASTFYGLPGSHTGVHYLAAQSHACLRDVIQP